MNGIIHLSSNSPGSTFRRPRCGAFGPLPLIDPSPIAYPPPPAGAWAADALVLAAWNHLAAVLALSG